MKKWITGVLSLVMLLSMTACSPDQTALTFEEAPKEFVLISGGSFTMGSSEDEPWRSADETQH